MNIHWEAGRHDICLSMYLCKINLSRINIKLYLTFADYLHHYIQIP